MDGDGVGRLLRKIGCKIGGEARAHVEGQLGFAAVEHDGAQKAQIGRGQRPSIHRYDGPPVGRVDGDGTAVGITDHRNAELRADRRFQEYANQSVLQQQAMVCRAVLPRIRAVGAVDRCKHGIATPSLHEALLDAGRTDAHRLTRHMTRGTAAPVGAEALKEGAVTVDWTIDTQRRDHAAGIEKRFSPEGITDRHQSLAPRQRPWPTRRKPRASNIFHYVLRLP